MRNKSKLAASSPVLVGVRLILILILILMLLLLLLLLLMLAFDLTFDLAFGFLHSPSFGLMS